MQGALLPDGVARRTAFVPIKPLRTAGAQLDALRIAADGTGWLDGVLAHFEKKKIPFFFEAESRMNARTPWMMVALLVMSSSISATVLELDSENWAEHTRDQRVFVAFYAPWCSHCQRLHPVWDAVAARTDSSAHVRFGRIDCISNVELCESYDINAFPTMVLLDNAAAAQMFDAEPTAEALSEFIGTINTALCLVKDRSACTARQNATLTAYENELGTGYKIRNEMRTQRRLLEETERARKARLEEMKRTWDEYMRTHDVNVAEHEFRMRVLKELLSRLLDKDEL